MKNSKINLYLEIFLKSIFAGIAIALGGLMFLKTKQLTDNLILSAFLFSIGLILVLSFGFFLYTGKICYLFSSEYKIGKYCILLLIGIIGNYVGTLIVASLIKACNLSIPGTNIIIEAKEKLTILECIIRGFFCGLLIYFAVEGYKTINSGFGKYLIVIFCVGAFIICGFEHCVADMFYLSLDNVFSINNVVIILFIMLGNSIGGLFVPLLNKIIN